MESQPRIPSSVQWATMIAPVPIEAGVNTLRRICFSFSLPKIYCRRPASLLAGVWDAAATPPGRTVRGKGKGEGLQSFGLEARSGRGRSGAGSAIAFCARTSDRAMSDRR